VPPSLTELKRIYDRSLAYARNANSADDVSEFWAEILAGRKNFPEFNDMLVMRRGFTYPLADRSELADLDAERTYALAAHDVVSRDVPPSFLAATEESPFGSPVAFEFGDCTFSAGGLVNALTAFRIVSWCERLGLKERPLNILEIGAGYGQVALQLHGRLDIARYTVCDLPENGFLGAFYLQANLPGPAAYMEPDGLDGPPDAKLVFAPPSALERLDGPYDLIVNSYSFQEMTRKSVDAYLAHAERVLTADGTLYSLNAHGKAGIEHPHQYRASELRVRGIRSVRRFPWQLFGTVPYELVQGRNAGPATVEDQQLDALGRAMQLGLHDELGPLCDAVDGGSATDQQRAWLSEVATMLGPGDAAPRLAAARAMLGVGVEPAVSAYLAGTLEFVRGEHTRAAQLLSDARAGLGQTAALQRALLMLSAIRHGERDRREGERLAGQARDLAPHLGDEIDRWKSDREGLVEMLASALALPAEGWSSRMRLARSRARGLRLRLR
jgi:putative sugar O-methyltransferase